MNPSNAVSFRENEVITLVGSIAAGCGLNVEYSEAEEIPCPYTSPEYVALRVVGDSMYPKIEDGDVVIVRQQDSVNNGEIAAVLINGDTEATVKTVRKQASGGIVLEAYNSEVYPARYYSPEEIRKLPVRIFGRVVEVRKSV